ncbi:bifunctional [glutamate--ammonia ligase]-adenylyl-L-tyrosine phosphorylase/[glutamate--ammonia-ligase] adenylyltransferase [Spongiibacter marinus]|uniref:bifunctional [glutamate--ammonia ligase]-adenylyl-L-tyrosine phosphorylase/[glutamate--ammonia-ligase] adenylyltransferase n=1 Tax=Spongiibacter marinus TaxID=354246 RepID=UPI001960D7DA|nr:bifunctional [glutamate--ammonia ligase]-adenylyl-L-tyrosine phosphorylase/[glutamate--ammonia-ligase] adenylyltransferase [Spongiibacter marinus]MBM7424601.1 glutamate-ammonia-ligase adenylyltransferase [Spongiibacter marinus]
MSTALNVQTDELPALLAEGLDARWQSFLQRCSEPQAQWYQEFTQSEARPKLLLAIAASPIFLDYCQRFPQALIDLQQQGLLDAPLSAGELTEQLAAECDACSNADELAKTLRQFRYRHWLRLVWRDLNRLCDMVATTAELSALADVCVQQALAFLHRELCREWGEPQSADGRSQQLSVIAMGKLGAGELNLSSDIDLIFSYPEAGSTAGGPRSVDNQEFFIRLGQRLIKALDARTADGFVFRVDMRLRPYGQSGPLVVSFDAMEEYYQDQGRDWERYALIKARCIAGDEAANQRLMASLRPFTYRRYLDFSAIESLRDMKAMIQREVARRSLHNNIKLGAGGIREIEFIAQCFQLIRGGQEISLQQRPLRIILDELRDMELLPAPVVDELQAANVFLRNAEHAIQAWRDEQTQQLPDAPAPQAALALSMGYDSWEAFTAALAEHRQRVDEHFANIIAAPEEEGSTDRAAIQRWEVLLNDPDADSLTEELQAAGYNDAAEVARRLLALLTGAGVQRMQGSARERLDDFLPLLLEQVQEAEDSGRAFLRLIPLIEAVLRRTAYLVLLMENPAALGRLVRLCDASPWVSRQLAAHPVLLDELLDASSLYSVPDKDGLRSELRQRLLRIPEDDLEAQMEALRYFRLAHVLRVAASEITGSLPLMKVSDYLTFIAETVMEFVVDIAWQNLVEKHGTPCGDDPRRHFVILAYGKMGGIELGYGSDLDLVFVHDVPAGVVSDGERPLDGTMFYTRLGQRIIHILTAQTRLGQLYEVDMRLRPSGNSGLLVSSFSAFRDYQRGQAWTWEHQALVRARVVAGDPVLAEKFTELRADVLGSERDLAKLREDVLSMRDKMRQHLLPSGGEKNHEFDIKQGLGGIVDIEFMVQYAVLAWSHQHPPLHYHTDNIRILESLQQEGLIPEADARALIEAYIAFRSQSHRASLQEQKGQLSGEALAEERGAVRRIWQQIFDEQ